MELINNLYKIKSESVAEGLFSYEVELNPEHFIYKAHFPGAPITPGVCIMQISTELTERSCGKTLEIQKVNNVKFLKTIVPQESPVLQVSGKISGLDDDMVKSQISISAGDDVCAKLSITFRTER